MKTLKIESEDEARSLFAFFNLSTNDSDVLSSSNPIPRLFYITVDNMITPTMGHNQYYSGCVSGQREIKPYKSVFEEYAVFNPFSVNFSQERLNSARSRLVLPNYTKILSQETINKLYALFKPELKDEDEITVKLHRWEVAALYVLIGECSADAFNKLVTDAETIYSINANENMREYLKRLKEDMRKKVRFPFPMYDKLEKALLEASK